MGVMQPPIKKGNTARGIGEGCIEETTPIGDILTCRMQGLCRSQEEAGGGRREGRRKRRWRRRWQNANKTELAR